MTDQLILKVIRVLVCACISVCECACLHVNNYNNSLSAWIVMGTVVAIIMIMAGIVITILIIIIYVLWKRYSYISHHNNISIGHMIIVSY